MLSKAAVLFCLFSILIFPLVAPEPPLAFREDWKNESGGAQPPGDDKLSNADLSVAIYGTGRDRIQIVHSGPNDTFLSMGNCEGHCALTLRNRKNYFDLSNPESVIRWRTMQDGFYDFKVVIRLADGTWLISDHNQGGLPEWVEDKYTVKDYHWYRLNMDTFATGPEVFGPDFRKVDEIGCACNTEDETGCANSPPGLLRMDWIEVYGSLVPRS